MKEEILRLRKEGKSYNEIVKILGCSKGTVAYHCGEGQKQRNRERVRRHRSGESGPKKVKKIIYCRSCGDKIRAFGKKFCNSRCHQRYLYNEYVEKWKRGEVSGGHDKNKSEISGYIRRFLWEKHKGKCSRCGWNTPNPITGKPILEVEHIDGNSLNHQEENLDLICPNCHSLTTTYKALNYGNGNKDRLKYHKLI